MVRLTGENRQKLVGSPFANYFTDPERAASGVRTTLERGVVQNYELVLKSKSGGEMQVSFNAAVFRDTASRVSGIFAAARDIGAQKSLEKELREQQAYNRGLIEFQYRRADDHRFARNPHRRQPPDVRDNRAAIGPS